MNQQLTFDWRTGLGVLKEKPTQHWKLGAPRLEDGPALRDAGVAKLERHPWLARVRRLAVAHCELYGSITSDDLHDIMEPPPHPNCWGALFRDKRFVPTGERVQTKRASGHARWIQRWRLA